MSRGGSERKAATGMWRTVRALTIMVIGGAMLLAPLGSAGAEPTSLPTSQMSSAPASQVSGVSQPVASQPGQDSVAAASESVLAQAPSQQDSNPDQRLPERQRVAIGIAGIVLIGLVLGSRKLRKKPVFYVTWKRKG